MKDILFDDDARAKLLKGIKVMSRAVKSTLGPKGGTTIIESRQHTRGLTVTKDGVTVAKSISFKDNVMNLAARIMREAAERTAAAAGDGTSTSIVLAEKLTLLGNALSNGLNVTQFIRILNSETERIIDRLDKSSIMLTDDLLYQVARISANNDNKIGDIIGSVYKDVGPSGIVTIENSHTHETFYKVTNGIKFDRGYSNHLFINDHGRDQCILEDVKIIVCDTMIGNILDIEGVLGEIIRNKEKLLIIAPCSDNVIHTMGANVVKYGLSICNVDPPSFGYRQHELMWDIATSVGATYFSGKTGDDLSLIKKEDLGVAKRVIVGRNSTIIVKQDSDKTETDKRVSELWEQHALMDDKSQKEFILSRIASLSGGIGVIYVGGNTDMERKELYDRVDDAVCAVRAALQDGILPGGGVALYNASWDYEKSKLPKGASKEEKAVYELLYEVLQEPMMTMLRNSDLEIVPPTVEGEGYNIKTGELGSMIEMGVVDPTLVTKSALRNAVSVASTILSTKTVVYDDGVQAGPIISAKKV